TVWVKDASRAVGVAQNLISPELTRDFVEKLKAEYEEVRLNHSSRRSNTQWLTLEQARANKVKIDWDSYTPPKPTIEGIQVFDDMPLEFLVPYIDWTPFFHTWELKGSYPKILKDKDKGEEATKLLADAKAMLQRIVSERWLKARAVVGLFPANSIEDDIEVYKNNDRKEVSLTLHNLRQQTVRADDKPNYCLSDFIAPKDSHKTDYIGGFVVTTGIGIDEHIARFEADHDDYSSIMLKALADRLAEAFAEHMHDRMRHINWNIETSAWTPDYAVKAKDFDGEKLIKENYQGIRPAPGYPACPDHTEKPLLWQMLDAENRTGVKLTESNAMWPASSVSGWYFSHPDSRYFTVGKINRDQVEDYAKRKGMSMVEAERWLSPNLGYEPE
ncbi:MAG: methionine synthase, partial [Gammaproteobacteria bacterium]|nr:methionine synthase [Gammaproteobacteria bacterium]